MIVLFEDILYFLGFLKLIVHKIVTINDTKTFAEILYETTVKTPPTTIAAATFKNRFRNIRFVK